MPSVEQLQALLKAEPDDLFLNFGLAMEYANADQFKESLEQFDRVLELDPNYVVAHFQKGKTLLKMGDQDAARQALEAGIAQAQACGDQHAKSEMEQLLSAL